MPLLKALVNKTAAAAPPAKPWGAAPISFPAKVQLPNLTALAQSVHESLSGAVRDAVAASLAAAPGKCPGGLPKVVCAEDACAAAPCGAAQVCVPECGNCTARK